MITVEIPIQDKKNPPALKFPERCVHCRKRRRKEIFASFAHLRYSR